MKNKAVSVVQAHINHGEDSLQDVLESIPHGLAVFDFNLKLKHWNEKLISLLDVPLTFMSPAVSLNDILYVNWDKQENYQSNAFAARILGELSRAQTSNDLYSFNYEYRITKDRTLEIKGEIMPKTGIVLTFSDISLRANPKYQIKQDNDQTDGHMVEVETQRIREVEREREIMEQQASNAVQMAEDLALTREAAENAKKHIEAILNAISDVLITTDMQGNILTCNHAAYNMFGYTEDEIIGNELHRIVNSSHISTDTDIERMIITLAHDDKQKNHNGTGHKKCGTTFPIELNVREVIISNQTQYTIVITDITERHEAETLIREMALHDSLTGLANRNLLHQKLDESMRVAARMNKKVSVMFLDLDGFKLVNDMYGHGTGDKLLRVVANRLKNCARDVDTVARLGGDEFAIISVNIENEKRITTTAQRILDTVRKPIILDGHSHQIGTSIGISFFPFDSQNPEELIRMADVALYQAKHDGKNIFRLYDLEMDAQAKIEKQIEIDLENAIHNDELVLHYQPLLNAIDYSIVGAEALIRWEHPEKGMIPPFFFIPIAENSDLMLSLGQKILEMACEQARKWQDMGMPSFRTCVNISARQFQSADFVDNVKKALTHSGLDPSRLELEITEGMVIGDIESVARKLDILSELGISLAIDDFGTGYSSLAYLKRFSVHQLKIDQSFIRDITEDYDDAAITDAVIRLGHSLGLSIVAEGVETEEQVQILRQKGCDILQGYYFSKPIAAENFEQWVAIHTAKYKS